MFFRFKKSVVDIEKDKEEGALAFFGDKYEDDVRVVNIGNFSKELCGGTHVHNSNEVGLIVLINESSIGSNLRRVEMLSGYQAYNFINNAYRSYKSVSDLLQTNIDQVPVKLKSFIESYENMKDKIDAYNKEVSDQELKRIVNETIKINNLNAYIGNVNINNSNDAKDIAIKAINEHNLDLVFLIGLIESKTVLVGSRNNKSLSNLDISELVGKASKLYGGGASKDKELSIGGGPSQYDDRECIEYIKQELQNNI